MKKNNVICSPYSNKFANTNSSCFTNDNIILLKHYWNLRHPNNKITSNDYQEIWNLLNLYMNKYLCDNEKCWLRKLVTDLNVQSDIFTESFVPTIPEHWKKDPDAWLSDLDISKVMKQYEHTFNHFYFIGPSPIDYNAYDEVNKKWVWPELKYFDLKKYVNKQPTSKTHIGIIFNLDNHKGKGTHWVALFIDLVNNKIYYFDSNGSSIPRNIKKLTDVIKDQANIHFEKKIILSTNYPNSHQKKNSECGIYVIFFIVNMLLNNNWDLFKNGNIPDKEIFKYRKVYFDE